MADGEYLSKAGTLRFFLCCSVILINGCFYIIIALNKLISTPGCSLSAGKNYEKAQVPAFSKTEFFLGRAESILVAIAPAG